MRAFAALHTVQCRRRREYEPSAAQRARRVPSGGRRLRRRRREQDAAVAAVAVAVAAPASCTVTNELLQLPRHPKPRTWRSELHRWAWAMHHLVLLRRDDAEDAHSEVCADRLMCADCGPLWRAVRPTEVANGLASRQDPSTPAR